MDSTRFSLLGNQGPTKKGFGRLIAIVSSVIVALAIVGSFGINGVSRRGVVVRRAPIVVDGVSADNLIDYKNHVSKDGILASGTFLLAQDAMWCNLRNGDSVAQYSTINNLPDLTSVQWPVTTRIFNSSCLMKDSGFVDKKSIQGTRLQGISQLSSCTVRIEPNRNTKLAKAVSHLSGRCPFELLETWCSTYRSKYCVGLLKFPKGFSVLAVDYLENYTYPVLLWYYGRVESPAALVDIYLLEKRPYSLCLRSIAFLMDSGAVQMIMKAKLMSLVSIRRNVEVEVYTGVVKETELNLAVLVTATGFALVLMFAVALVAHINWRRYIIEPGRKEYNHFHSAADMLSCAVSEAMSFSTCRFRRKGEVTIGVRGKEPNATPFLQVDDSSESHQNPLGSAEDRRCENREAE